MADDNKVNIEVTADSSSVQPEVSKAASSIDNLAQAAAGAVSSIVGLSNAAQGTIAAQVAATAQLSAMNSQLQTNTVSLQSNTNAQTANAQAAANAAAALNPLATIVGALAGTFQATAQAAAQMAMAMNAATIAAQNSLTNLAATTTTATTSMSGSMSRLESIVQRVILYTMIRAIESYIEKTYEMVLSTENMAQASGVSVTKLAELQEVMQQSSAKTDGLDKALGRLTRSMEAAREGGARQLESFRQLGVETSNWHDELPPLDSVLQQVATHLQNSNNNLQDTAALQQVAGRQVSDLNGFLRQQGDQLTANMEAHRAHGEAMERAVAPALKLRLELATLSQEMRAIALEVLPGLVQGLGILEGVFQGVELDAKLLVDAILGIGTVGVTQLIGDVKAMEQIVTGDLRGAILTIGKSGKESEAVWKFYTDMMATDIQEASDKITAIRDRMNAPAKLPPNPSGDTDTDPNIKNSKAVKSREIELKGQMAHQLAILELKKKGFEDEEQLGELSADMNVNRVQRVNAEILATQLSFIDQMIAVAKTDPNNPDKVAELQNERVAVLDKAGATILASETHVAEATKRLQDAYAEDFRKMEEGIVEETNKAEKERARVLSENISKQITQNRKQSDDNRKTIEEQLHAEEAHSTRVQELYRQDVDFQYSLGLISLAQKNALLQASFDQEAAMQRQSLQKQIDALNQFDVDYTAKRQALIGQLQALEDRSLQQRQKSEEQSLTIVAQRYKSFIDDVGSAFQSNIADWAKGTKSFQQAFYDMGREILTNWIGTLVQMGVKYAEHEALKLALHLAGVGRTQAVDSAQQGIIEGQEAARIAAHAAAISEQEAIDLAASTTSVATAAATSAAEIINAAGLAGANAYASTAAIPIIGPELAPAVAATAVADTLGFLAFAEQGTGPLAKDQLMYLHKDEMVMPAPLSRGIQGIIAGNGPQQGSGKAPPGLNVTFAPTIHALDSSGVSDVLDRHQDVFISRLQSWQRDGHLG